jgi:transcriptional regulator with XRE-family HTH domain
MLSFRPAKLKDVASAAGVSATTVSRYMNGRLRLPEATERRILQAVEDTAYRPNPHARRLSTGRSDTIGLVVPDIANPFFARLAAAVEAEADARGLQVSLFVTLNRLGRERAYLEALARNQVDGLIFATNHGDHAELGPVRAVAGRLVIVDEDVPGIEAPRLFCDNFEGGRAAGEHLGALGHVRVGYVGAGPEMMSGRLRLAGLRAGLGGAARPRPFSAPTRARAARRPCGSSSGPRAGCPRSSWRRTRSPSARWRSFAPQGCACRRTCRSSPSTTWGRCTSSIRRSPPSASPSRRWGGARRDPGGAAGRAGAAGRDAAARRADPARLLRAARPNASTTGVSE